MERGEGGGRAQSSAGSSRSAAGRVVLPSLPQRGRGKGAMAPTGMLSRRPSGSVAGGFMGTPCNRGARSPQGAAPVGASSRSRSPAPRAGMVRPAAPPQQMMALTQRRGQHSQNTEALGQVATVCNRNSCKASPSSVPWAAYHVQLQAGGSSTKLPVGPACLKCGLAWKRAWHQVGDIVFVFGLCNNSPEKDNEFWETVEFGDDRQVVQIEWHPKESSQTSRLGVVAETVLVGLSAQEVIDIYGYSIQELGYRETNCWKVGGGSFAGIIVQDSPLLHGRGTRYRYYSQINIDEKQVLMSLQDNIRADQAAEVWGLMTEPSRNEPPRGQVRSHPSIARVKRL